MSRYRVMLLGLAGSTISGSSVAEDVIESHKILDAIYHGLPYIS